MTTTQIKERPILFSGRMVQAILRGDKTQTRREIKPQPECIDHDVWTIDGKILTGAELEDHLFHEVYGTRGTPYGAIWSEGGDRLWVRETFAPHDEPENHQHAKAGYTYRADWDIHDDAELRDFKWKPSIFMPRDASRITLELIDVRAERLQQISESDALAEGALDPGWEDGIPGGPVSTSHVARLAFESLWCGINGRKSWDSNPWVWALTFKKVPQ